MMPRVIERCRVCGNRELVQVVDLGEQALTGVFPRSREQIVTSGPLRLVKCTGNEGACGLLQLQHSYDLREMYGENYGYRSGLNSSMVSHLHSKVQRILGLGTLKHGDLVIDIGSNDATTLRELVTEMVASDVELFKKEKLLKDAGHKILLRHEH